MNDEKLIIPMEDYMDPDEIVDSDAEDEDENEQVAAK
jgi:hypothetical protein